jgi:hypothetical protein
MMPPARTVDRFIFGALYLLVGALTIWGGFGLIDRVMEVRLLSSYLLRWEACLTAFGAQQGQWPLFSGHNHVAYMDGLTNAMARSGIRPPASNTAAPYRYHLVKFGSPDEDLFLLGLRDRMVIFGLSAQSMQRLDRLVDGRAGLNSGRLTGRPATVQGAYIGQWRL